MSQSQLPDSQSSPQHQSSMPVLDAMYPRVTTRRDERQSYAHLSNTSFDMDAFLANYAKPFSDEEISSTFQEILAADSTGLSVMPEFLDDGVPSREDKLKCRKCRQGDEEKPVLECLDCERRYHLKCHNPCVTEEEYIEVRTSMIWYCAECSLAYKMAEPEKPKPPPKKAPLKLTLLKFSPGEPTKNNRGEWVSGGSWITQKKPAALKPPQEIFPSIMATIAATQPITFHPRTSETCHVRSRKTTHTGQPAGLAAWAAKLKAAKQAKKEKSKAAETVVRSEETPNEESSEDGTKKDDEATIVKEIKNPGAKLYKGKRLERRLEVLLADAKTLVGDAVPSAGEKRCTRSQSAMWNAAKSLVKVEDTRYEENEDYLDSNDDMELPDIDSGPAMPPFIPDIPAKRPRIASREKSVKKQLKLTINLTEEKVSFEEKDEEPRLKRQKKDKNRSEKRSSKRKSRGGGYPWFKEGTRAPNPRANYEDKSSDEEEMRGSRNVMPTLGLQM